MESLSSAKKTMTVQELLRRRSPLSVHHHLSSSKRKRSPGAGLPENLPQRKISASETLASEHDIVRVSLTGNGVQSASEILSWQHDAGGVSLAAGNGLQVAALETLAHQKDYLAPETLADQNDAGRVLFTKTMPQQNLGWKFAASETLVHHSDEGRASSMRNMKQHTVGSTSSNSRTQADVLRLSEQPLLLLGWIQLWNCSPHEADCLAFSDCSGTICCAVRDFDPQLLGCPVHILSWSYIPEREKGGCLEIRHLAPMGISNDLPSKSIYLCPETANVPNLVLETPPSKQNTRTQRLAFAGCVSFISPPFTIPHGESRSKQAICEGSSLKMQSVMVSKDLNHSVSLSFKEAPLIQTVEASKSKDAKLQNVATSMSPNKPLLGFFVGLCACIHNPSCLPPMLDHCRILGTAGYDDCEPAKQHVCYIYFSGSTVSWRPILLATSGKCILLTGLRKKVLVTGEQRTQYRIYAATRISSVTLCTSSYMERLDTTHCDRVLQIKALHMVKEHNRQKLQQICELKKVGSYVGVVTEIFVRGGLLELDGCVWLLLTHQPLSQVRGLRVGATVTALHVHFLRVTGFFERTLLLAACSISHLVVTHFSPLQIVYPGKRDSQSCLSRFIESLPFLSAFWALQVIASFKQKFRGFYNEKEILGSVKNMGIAEIYLRNLLSASNIYRRNIFEEFFSHNTSCSLAELVPCNFSLQVPPIRNFCKQIQIMWLDRSSCIWNVQHKTIKREVQVHDLGEKRNFFVRRVISSDILGLTILGFLQFSSALGKLQLLDATGAIDVIIPDLQTTQCLEGACQVTTYKLVIEGYLEPFSCVSLDLRSLPMSWYSILKGTPFSMDASKQFSLFLIFSIKEAHLVQYIRHLNYADKPPRKGGVQVMSPFFKADKENTCSLDMLFVLHKYPIKFKSFSKQTGDCSLSFCVEAVKLPYSICIFKDPREIIGPEVAAEMLDSSIICTGSILFLSNACDVLKKGTDSKDEHQGYTSYHSLLKRRRSKMDRLLFQFNDTYKAAFEVIEIGHCYLVQSLPDPAVTTMHGGSPFWSLVADYDHGTNLDADGMQKVILEAGSSLPFVDVVLKLPLTFETEFNSSLKDARAYLSPVLSVGEVLDHGKSLCKGEQLKPTGVLKGSLLSFFGTVESFDLRQILPFSKFQCISANEHKRCGPRFLLKDLNSSQSIMVSCDPNQHARPVGCALGAVVAMHRALLQLSANGDVSIKCIPSTLIEVCHVGKESFSPKSDRLSVHKERSWTRNQCENLEQELTKIGAIYLGSCTNSSIPKSLKVHCRVVSVERLLIERDKVLDKCTISLEDAIYKVQHVTVILDDGSGLAICWAHDEAAASLLHIPLKSGHHCGLNWNASEKMHVIGQLNAFVRKYEKILFHSINQHQDFPSDSFMIHGAEDRVLDSVEKMFIYGIVQRACHAGLLDVVAEHRLPEDSTNQLCEVQEKKVLNERAPWPTLVARKVEAVRYERHLTAITKNLESTLQKLEDSCIV